MRESCYCGRVGEVEDREPVWRNGRTEALRCPRCGHLDPLPCLDAAARHSCAHKAVVIRLRDEDCERLVVEVEDPEGAVERINRAVGARAQAASRA